MSAEVTRAVTSDEQPPLHGNSSGVGRYVSNSFRCKEGSIMIAARSQNLRSRFWKAIAREDIPKDPRFATDAAARQNMKELEAEVQKTLATRTAREWQEKFNQEGVPAMQVLSLLEAVNDPHIAAREFIKRFDADSGAGLPAYGVPAMPYRFSQPPPAITKRAPRLGEHTDAILTGWACPAKRSPACAAGKSSVRSRVGVKTSRSMGRIETIYRTINRRRP
jgi:crotonobetainyl-CoA:carnitine CoA-transferase CaiB-like acyl-CoA transferase